MTKSTRGGAGKNPPTPNLSLDKRVRFSREGEIVEKNKEREASGLSKRVKNNYLGIISLHRSVCTTAVFAPHQSGRG